MVEQPHSNFAPSTGRLIEVTSFGGFWYGISAEDVTNACRSNTAGGCIVEISDPNTIAALKVRGDRFVVNLASPLTQPHRPTTSTRL